MEFIHGFLAPFRGFARLVARPALWPWALVPIALNVVLVVVLGWLWFSRAEPRVEHWMAPRLAAEDGWLAHAMLASLRVVLSILALPTLLVVFMLFAHILGGPFYEVLCARTESEILGAHIGDESGRHILRVIVDGIRVETGNFVVGIVGSVVAFVLGLAFPGPGTLAAMVLGWFLAGFNFIAYPFDRRALSLAQKLRVTLDHAGASIGFGLASWILLVPIVTFPLVAPCAVIGAAMLFPGARRLRRKS